MECWEQGNAYMETFIYLSVNNQILKAYLRGTDLIRVGEESTDDFYDGALGGGPQRLTEL